MDGYLRGQPDVSWWLQQVHRGIAWRRKMSCEADWQRWRGYYRGVFRPGVLPSNAFFKMIRSVVPRTYFRNPSVSITAAKPGIENWVYAKLLERLDNRLIRDMRMKKQIKTLVQRAFFCGTSVLKLGYTSQFATPSVAAPESGVPITVKGGAVEYNSLVEEDKPWVMGLRSGDFVVPEETIALETTRWTAEWLERPLEDLEQDERFKSIRGSKSAMSQVAASMQGSSRPDMKMSKKPGMVDLLEIHDKKYKKVMVLAPYMTDRVLLFDDDTLLSRRDVPYYGLCFNEDDESFWGVPDAKILEPQQLELNEIRTQEMKHRRLALIKAFVRRNALKQEEITKMTSEEVLAVIAVDGDPNYDVAFREIGIPQGLSEMELSIMQDIREQMGMSRNEFGEFNPPNSRTSATEAQIVKVASEIRVDERRDMIADLLVDVIEDLNDVIVQRWDQDQIIEMAGPMGVPIWVQFKATDLQSARYTLKIDPDSTLPQTKEMREQKALLVYERFKLNPLIDPIKLTQYLLHEMHGVEFDDMFRGIPPGLGTQTNPMNVGQFGGVMQQFGQRMPQLLQGGGGGESAS